MTPTIPASALALALAAAAGPAFADSVALDAGSGWQTFAVDSFLAPVATPLRWIDDSGALRTFTFHVGTGQSALLTIVDGGFAGDTFSVTSNGSFLGTTTAVPAGSVEASHDVGLDFDAALADASFSRGLFSFGPGDYTLGGSLLQSATFGGTALDATAGAVRLAITSPVPEPESIALLLAGFAAVGAWTRRRAAR